MEFYNNLLLLRDKAGMTQGDVAEAIGLGQAEYSRIEKKKRRVGPHISALAKLLNCTEEEILDVQGAPVKVELSNDLPVYALPEADGESIRFDLAMSTKTERPPRLFESPNAFAMFNCGSCMLPRVRHGDLLYCDPDAQIKVNDLCVVVLTAGNRAVAVVREFLGDNLYHCTHDNREEKFGKELQFSAPVISVDLSR